MKNNNECIGLIAGHSGDSLTDELHNLGYEVAIVGGKKNEPGMSNADFVLVQDLDSYNEIIDFFLDHKVKRIVIGTGHSKALGLSNKLNMNGLITNIDYELSMLAKDKIKFKDALKLINVDTPKYLSFKDDNINCEEIIHLIGLPCVVKSAVDAIQPQKVDNYKELCDAINEVNETNTDILIEEYIKGNDCTVAVKSNGMLSEDLGVTYYSKAREYKLKGFNEAYSAKMSFETEKELCLIARKVTEEMGFIGLVRVDFIVADKIYALELNSVIVTGYNGSAYPFFKAQDINIAKVMIDNAIEIFKYKEKLLNS